MNGTDAYPHLCTSSRRKANIQIIPLIDVVFFLLATFVLFTLSLNRLTTIPLTLPVGGEGKGVPPLVLQVTDAGIYWDKELVTTRELPVRLEAYAKENKHPRIMLAGDDTAKYGATAAALDEVRKAGIKEVSIETLWRGTGR